MTRDWVNIDHRRGVAFAPGDMTAYIRATLDDTPDFKVYLEAVHRLTDLGAVVTGVERDLEAGFHAEWREIDLATVDGDLINRCELFDETDLGEALASFDELRQRCHPWRTRQAESSTLPDVFVAHDWDAIAEILAEDIFIDDRRRVVGAGVRRGRDPRSRLLATADLGVTD